MLRNQKIKISLLSCLLLPTLLASELQAQNTNNASNGVIPGFVTPSGNIYCAIVGEEKKLLRCEIQSMLKPLPPQPYSRYCEFDWGSGFLLNQQGKPEILCISDTIGKSNYILSYGQTWINSGFQCVSKKTELTCNNSDGHGFFLSRNKWGAF